MSEQPPPGAQPSEEELRAAYEEQLKRLRVDDVLIQTVVSLVNLGGAKAGLAGPDQERDMDQLRQAIEGVRALLPLVEPKLGPDAAQLRQALSQLQLAYARGTGGQSGGPTPAGGAGGAQQEPGPEEQTGPGPAQSSGRLWVPGQ
jgi:hypothetical protein